MKKVKCNKMTGFLINKKEGAFFFSFFCGLVWFGNPNYLILFAHFNHPTIQKLMRKLNVAFLVMAFYVYAKLTSAA